MANKSFYKAVGKAAKITGKDRKDLIRNFRTCPQKAPAELVSALITAHRIYDGYKKEATTTKSAVLT